MVQLLDPSLPPAVAEARLLHPAAPDGSPGYFVLARRDGDRWREHSYSADAAEPVLRGLAGVEDAYITQATFVGRRRLASMAHTLRCAFTDLDLYNVGMRADDASIEAVMRHASEAGIPQPSLIVSSGRGLYAKWLFDRPITSTLMPQWNALQGSLIALYRKFGCDPKVRDAARVLRSPSSINSKSGSEVKVVLDTGRTWSFAQLCEQVGQVCVETELADQQHAGAGPARAAASKRTRILLEASEQTDLGHLATYSARREPIMLKQMTAQSLNWARFLDMRDLAIARGGIHRGWRDEFLFWMVCFLGHSGIVTTENFDREVEQLLMAFPRADDFQPLQDGSLETIKRKIKDAREGKFVRFNGSRMSPIYTPSNDYLIDRLQICANEERALRTLISGQERQRRADLKVPGRCERRIQRKETEQVILELSQQGVGASEIAATVGCSRATVYRARSKAEAVGKDAAPLENRGRRSPYAEHQQQLPPSRERAGQEGQHRVRPSERKNNPHGLNERELARRRRGACPAAAATTTIPSSVAAAATLDGDRPVQPGADVAAYVARRLEQIRQESQLRAARRQQDRDRTRAEAEAQEAQVQLRMQARLMRVMAHACGETAPTAASPPAAHLKPDRSPGRLRSATPPAAAPPQAGVG